MEQEETPTPADFAREYQALCERMGFRLAVVPAWVPRDDNTFSMVMQVSVEPLPKGSV